MPTAASALGSSQNPQSGSVGLEGTVAGPPPANAPTVSTPGNGQTVSHTPITVAGLCANGLLVKVFVNNIFTGSAQCTGGSYSIQSDLFSGRNDIVVRQYDALDQSSPDSNLVSVTLAEGAVAVSDRATSSDWSETLAPGEQLKISTATGVKEKLNVDTTALTSWSHGRLIFKDSPLTEVLDELNRYAATKIRIGDNRLASIPIGGDFIAGGSSEQVVDALAALLPLRVVYIGPNEIVLFHRYEIETP